MAFKDRLKQARKSKGLTQEQLGKYLEIAKSTVAGYERGSSEPDMQKLQLIMRALDVDANFLFQDEMESKWATQDSVDCEIKIENNIERQLILNFRSLSTEGKESLQRQMIMHVNTYKNNDNSGFQTANSFDDIRQRAEAMSDIYAKEQVNNPIGK